MNEETKSNSERLLEIMIQKEAREEKEYLAREAERIQLKEDHQRRVETRKAGDAFGWEQDFKRKANCDHRKGTSGPGPKAKHIDYDISRHVFANGVTQIKCLKCRHRAFPGDTKEKCHGTMDNYVANVRAKKGPQLPNPTKRSYQDWHVMTLEENTTNKETRAEIITQAPQLPTL
jgi:hypothetical protein